MLRYTVLLMATISVALFSEMAANEGLTPWVVGGISEPHANLRAECGACHEPWRGPSAQRCLQCHAFFVLDRRAAQGAPGADANPTLEPGQPSEKLLQCAQCHEEHMELAKLVKAPFDVTEVHQLGHPENGTCANCHADLDHGEVLPCTMCHQGDPTKTTETGAHVGMRAR